MPAGRAHPGRFPGVTVGTFRGIALRIDSSWVLIFLVVAWSAAAYFPRALPGVVEPGTSLVLGLLASAVLFASVVAHELSHSLVARALGYEVRSITLFIFGGVSEIAGEPRTARDEGAIAIAGPILSFLLALVFAVVGGWAPPLTVAHAFLRYMAAANFAVGVFNLFPGFPLDGGRVLRAFFRALGDDLVRSTRKAAFVGRALGLAFIALGLMSFFLGGALPGIWLGLIGWFLRSSADSGYRQVLFRAQVEDLHVGEVAERLVPLAPEATVEAALRHHGLYAGSHLRYPVAEGGRLLGMVQTATLRAVPRERWREMRIGELLDEGPSASVLPEASLLEAVELMASSDRSELPVADAAGIYLGVLRLEDVARLGQKEPLAEAA